MDSASDRIGYKIYKRNKLYIILLMIHFIGLNIQLILHSSIAINKFCIIIKAQDVVYQSHQF